MRFTVRYMDFPYEYENLGDEKVFRSIDFDRFEDAYNEAMFIYVNGIDENVDIKDNEYDVIFSVKEKTWY